jgi:hypothetical protein
VRWHGQDGAEQGGGGVSCGSKETRLAAFLLALQIVIIQDEEGNVFGGVSTQHWGQSEVRWAAAT